MLLKIKANLGSADFPGLPLLEDEVHEVSEPVAARLLKRRLAEPVEEKVVAKMEVKQESVIASKSPVVVTPEVPAVQTKTKTGK